MKIARKQICPLPRISNYCLNVNLSLTDLCFCEFSLSTFTSLLFQVDKPVSRTKPKKTPTTTTGKMVKKTKEKQIASSQSAKKKPSSGAAEPKPGGVVATKKSKEISNRLAEAKHWKVVHVCTLRPKATWRMRQTSSLWFLFLLFLPSCHISFTSEWAPMLSF